MSNPTDSNTAQIVMSDDGPILVLGELELKPWRNLQPVPSDEEEEDVFYAEHAVLSCAQAAKDIRENPQVRFIVDPEHCETLLPVPVEAYLVILRLMLSGLQDDLELIRAEHT